jgi:hypothetical protein
MELLSGKTVFVNAGVRPGTSLDRAAGKRGSYHGCATAASATTCCKISAALESQQPRIRICLFKVRAIRKDSAQHYKGKWLHPSQRK